MTMIPVTTRSYDNSRSGANLNEPILTQNAVASQGVRRLFRIPVPGDARGCEAQPLLVPAMPMNDGLTHDLCLVASMGNYLSAFDANTGQMLWSIAIGRPIANSKRLDGFMINDHWGILSTPVIDLDSHILYCCVWSSPDGTPDNARFWLHARRIVDGSLAAPPLDLTTVSYNPGHNLPVQHFTETMRKQRASLLFTDLTDAAGVRNKTVFVAFGTMAETLGSARGWVIACRTAPSLQVSATWTSTARYGGAGIWHAGGGLVADAAGNIYLMTGNGAFDGVTDFGEAFVKLQYTPPSASIAGKLQAIDWFAPYSDAGRVGQTQSNPQINVSAKAAEAHVATPTNVRRSIRLNSPGNLMDWNDQDLGASGPLLIPELNLLLGAGKDGILYVMDSDNLGRTQRLSFDNPASNYALLKAPPIWYTYFPGYDYSPAPEKFTDLDFNFANRTHHLHAGSVYYHSPVHGPMLFCWGENGNLRAWSIGVDGRAYYLAGSAEFASPQAPIPPGGMPGGLLCLSADGQTIGTAVLWALVPYGDANRTVTGGMLYAYDAENFVLADGGGNQLKLLWSSADWGLGFSFNKFNPPVVAGGKIYVPTYDATVDVYGLA